jgi:16S rRNA (cytosine967-C5)-methyltransferase
MGELGPDKAERTPLETTLRLVRGGDLSRLKAIAEGHAFVQDISQAKVARKVPVEKAGRIVDACAAPGGKTLAALSRSRGKAFVVSADVSAERLHELAQALDRCGFPARCLAADARAFDRTFLEPFDVALADVPCSNTGVLRRRVDARWRVQPSDLTALTAWQLDLAAGAGRIVKKGGLLIYTTCSVLPAENDGVVKELVRKEGWVLVAQELILPGTDNGDGAFIAMLGKA